MANLLNAGTFVPKVLKSFMATSGLEPTLLGATNLRILNARPGLVNFELEIKKQHTNRLKILHGGTIASMVDLGGSLAVASMGLYATGVSTDLNVTFLSSGGNLGDRIKASAVCEKMGKTLAFTHISFFNAKGDLFARGSHTKFIEKARQSQDKLYEDPVTRDENQAKENEQPGDLSPSSSEQRGSLPAVSFELGIGPEASRQDI